MRNCKITMNLGHGGSPFADGAAHALYRAGAHVADREYTRDARLERGNGVSGNSLGYHLPGQHEAIRVDRRAATSEPFSFRVRTNEQEDVMYRPLFLGTAGAIAPRHGFESSLRVTVQLGQFGIEVQFDVGSRLDTLAACCPRYTAACPAELPPPTRVTSSPAHVFASSGDAQYHTPRPSNSAMRGR